MIVQISFKQWNGCLNIDIKIAWNLKALPSLIYWVRNGLTKSKFFFEILYLYTSKRLSVNPFVSRKLISKGLWYRQCNSYCSSTPYAVTAGSYTPAIFPASTSSKAALLTSMFSFKEFLFGSLLWYRTRINRRIICRYFAYLDRISILYI